jgi:hypothetical protein
LIIVLVVQKNSMYFLRSIIQLVLVCIFICATKCQEEVEDGYSDGYEYVYEYEVDTNQSQEDVPIVDNTDATAAALKREEDTKIAAVAAEEEEAIQRAITEENMTTQQRRMALRGYKKSVGGSKPTGLAAIANSRYVDITEVEMECLPNSRWGQLIVPPKVIVPEDAESKRAKELLSKAGATGGNEEHNDSDEEGNDEKDETNQKDKDKNRKERKPKKMSFRELQAKRTEEKKARAEQKQEKSSGYRVGTSCENLVCGSCKILVEEFAQSVVDGGKDESLQYIEDIVSSAGRFCTRKQMKMGYKDEVEKMCMNIVGSKTGYKEVLLIPFEQDANWERVTDVNSLMPKVRQICTDVGACQNKQFDIQMVPANKEQEHWDDKCYTCQAFAKELEERLHLTRGFTERSITPIIEKTCDRIDWPVPSFKRQCKPMTEGSLLEDISWISFMHAENIERKGKADKLFGDSLCESINFCQKWTDPDAEEEVVMEEVFF